MILDHGVFLRVLYYEQSTILLQETKIMYKNTNALIREQGAVNLDT